MGGTVTVEAVNPDWEDITKEEEIKHLVADLNPTAVSVSNDAIARPPSSSGVSTGAKEANDTSIRQPRTGWRELKEKNTRVMRSRVELNELRARLKIEHAAISGKENDLLLQLKALALEYTPHGLQALIRAFEALQEAREHLRPKEDELESLERLLIADEWAIEEVALHSGKESERCYRVNLESHTNRSRSQLLTWFLRTSSRTPSTHTAHKHRFSQVVVFKLTALEDQLRRNSI